jgi:RNA-directed DNA polymerase
MRSRIDALLNAGGGGRKIASHVSYEDIISLENLLSSWQEVLRGKRRRKDVAEFSLNFLDNILELREELVQKTYRHGGYKFFKINDPKPRDIHKAAVRDRLVHHALYRVLYSHFDRVFIYDSYSCRKDKGTHRAINRFRDYASKVSRNSTRSCWVLKGDIRKFFANIDHKILKKVLAKYLEDESVLWLLGQVVDSFNIGNATGVGLPLGNLTSQLLVNVYMNEFDQFAKRQLKAKYYIRYADDFVILSESKKGLEEYVPLIARFLENSLRLSLHPDKLYIKTLASGLDFLGWVHFPHHRVLRTSTKKRMFRNLSDASTDESITSYLGLISHGNTNKLSEILREKYSEMKN